MKSTRRFILGLLALFCGLGAPQKAHANVIEKQLQDIGSIPNEEIVVVQRKYTRKNWRSEFTPVAIGGVPFGTVKRTLFGGANYTLHFNDSIAWEALNLVYSKTFFSSFVSDINKGQNGSAADCLSGTSRPGPCVGVDDERLLYLLTTGFEYTPFYGKLSTFSRFIAYVEPYVMLGIGMAKTDSHTYAALSPGIGFRVYFKEWFSMRLDFRDYLYNEQFTDRSGATPTTGSRLSNNYAFMVSLSFWLPKMPSN